MGDCQGGAGCGSGLLGQVFPSCTSQTRSWRLLSIIWSLKELGLGLL